MNNTPIYREEETNNIKEVFFLEKLAKVLIIVFVQLLFCLPFAQASMNGDLDIGDFVLFGEFYDEPILWRVININQDGSRMLFSERIIALMGFDPRGNAPGGRANQHRLDRGSNYYPESTIRIWLNSDQEEVAYPYNPPRGHPDGFFYPQGYEDIPGFLTNFSPEEIELIVSHTHRVYIGNLDIEVRDGGTKAYEYTPRTGSLVSNSAEAYYKEVTDRVFILGAPELQRYVYDRGWDILKKPTPELVQRFPWIVEAHGFSPDKNHKYWLNTAFPPTNYSFLLVVGDGTRTYHGGYIGTYFPLDNEIGLVPALNISPETTALEGDGTLENPYILFREPEPCE